MLEIQHSLRKFSLIAAKIVYTTKNIPDSDAEQIATHAKVVGVEVVSLDITNEELGTLCKKPFSISVLALTA